MNIYNNNEYKIIDKEMVDNMLDKLREQLSFEVLKLVIGKGNPEKIKELSEEIEKLESEEDNHYGNNSCSSFFIIILFLFF